MAAVGRKGPSASIARSTLLYVSHALPAGERGIQHPCCTHQGLDKRGASTGLGPAPSHGPDPIPFLWGLVLPWPGQGSRPPSGTTFLPPVQRCTFFATPNNPCRASDEAQAPCACALRATALSPCEQGLKE